MILKQYWKKNTETKNHNTEGIVVKMLPLYNVNANWFNLLEKQHVTKNWKNVDLTLGNFIHCKN